MSFEEQVEAARGHTVTLSCGLCPNRQTIERLELHPVNPVVVVPRDRQGKGRRRASWRLEGWPGQSHLPVAGTYTWHCPRGHTFPITDSRLLAAFLAAFADNRRRIVAGVDV